MPLVIGPIDELGLEGVPWLDVGLIGVTSNKHKQNPNQIFPK